MPTSPSTRFRAGLAVAACGAIGAGIGIAGAAAAPGAKSKSKSTSRSATQGATSGQPAPPAPPRPPYGGGSPPVHEQAVVLDRAGKSFITVTTDNGTVDSVAGDQLAITESAGKVTYQKVTLTIPSGATVIREGKKATLSQVKSGDHVLVRQSSDGTFVLAGDGAMPRFGPGGRPGGFRGPGGPGPWQGGPPPLSGSPPPGGPPPGGSSGSSGSSSAG